MKKLAPFLIAAVCTTTLVNSASAHVSLTYPSGGETFTPGSHITIAWQLVIEHDQQNWDLYFSSDGGATWNAIQLDLPVDLRSYDWTVPEIETTQGRIKIVQDNTGLDYTDNCADFLIRAIATGVDDSGSLPGSPDLLAVYPNPFTSSTAIEFALPHSGEVSLKVFDIRGAEVMTLAEGSLPTGRHLVHWRPSDLAKGIYLVRFVAANQVQTMRVVLRGVRR